MLGEIALCLGRIPLNRIMTAMLLQSGDYSDCLRGASSIPSGTASKRTRAISVAAAGGRADPRGCRPACRACRGRTGCTRWRLRCRRVRAGSRGGRDSLGLGLAGNEVGAVLPSVGSAAARRPSRGRGSQLNVRRLVQAAGMRRPSVNPLGPGRATGRRVDVVAKRKALSCSLARCAAGDAVVPASPSSEVSVPVRASTCERLKTQATLKPVRVLTSRVSGSSRVKRIGA